MNDHRKTKKQLIAELVQIRERVTQLEQAEAERKQLEEGRAFAGRVLTSSPDLICVAGMDGYFKYLNPAWEKSLGYTQAELLSRPFLDFIHPDDHAKNDAEVEKLAKGHPTLAFENRYKHKDGSILTISWTATPLLEQKVMYCIGRDITERKQAEDALRKSEARLLRAERIAHVGNVEGNFLTDEVYYSDEACRIYGIKSNDNKYTNDYFLNNIVHPDDRESVIEAEQEALLGKKFSIDHRIVRPDGEVRFVHEDGEVSFDESGKPIHVAGTVQDITERKNAEIKLKDTQNHLLTVFNNTSDLQLLFKYEEPKTFRIVTANQSYINASYQFGINIDNIVGKTLDDLVIHILGLDKNMLENTRRNYLQAIKSGQTEKYFESVIISGKPYHSEITLSPIFDSENNQEFVLYSSHDVTAEKESLKAFQESEHRYRLVFENSPVSIWEEDFSGVKSLFDDLKKEGVADIETYFAQHPETVQQCAELAKIVDVNRATLALHAAANKEELLAGLVNTFTPESFDTFRQELVCLWHGGTEMTRDAVVKTLAGEPRNVTVYFSVCPGYEETLSKVFVSLIDITERNRAEVTLRRDEKSLRLAGQIAHLVP